MNAGDSKIFSVRDLARHIDSLRKDRKVVLCHGVFDLLHIGHIKYFKSAKAAGDILVVTVTPDRFVNKGPNRPAFGEQLRCEAIAALGVVDFVALNEWPTAVETIRLLKPDIYAKGSEYKTAINDLTGKIMDEEQAVHEVGGSILFTEDIVFSSSKLINQFASDFPEETQKFFRILAQQYGEGRIISYLEKARKLKVLVIGEAILDEYNYCDMIGVATKDPAIGVRYLSRERFAGGILAVANNLANFCDSVDLISMVGQFETEETFIREHLAANVNPVFFYKENSPTIVKQRFVLESATIQKLFEVHRINQLDMSTAQQSSLNDLILSRIGSYDLVLVVDFGHGFISQSTARLIADKAKYLAVNTQANSGNRGFNVISKYPSADFVCLNDLEIRLEERNNPGTIIDMIKNVAGKLSCTLIIVTQGKQGCLCFHGGNNNPKIISVPAFAMKVVDRIGSGDALIAISSLCAVQNAPTEITGFIGNASASIAVSTVGHRSSIDNVAFKKYLSTLLK
ncbi:PfkB family carbohydrate kinase [Methanoregula sp. UBA64]|jgi:rfaE bifunctional protein kinase chain/domain/rfaE bifunctional protein nucleotidyltransferase chain/domain|uniref:PfkB family carbohydrate kinase n=1 Tax=Methanoregula sp. UBA64 TaxID=1915554 RepID=UPI0025D8ABEB|nr:PfkB family carbohydrate kinase [Methanoregula sp. UBA64]